ncbi:MAG: UDP-glucose/GDP-mannose dehydrogenase family protein [Chitinophagales bacterium]|nr:UDP-glucose/GDP-mannose dehydrogenase family protein [Chitinophagales bacterium]
MQIAVIGTGYVGLVTGTCFAETGNNVTCVDIDPKKVEKLNNGELTIYEPGLENLFLHNKKQGRLHFTLDLAAAIKDAQLIFLALPTPPDEDGSADLKYILNAAADIGKLLTDYKVIINKSTVPVGTAEKVRAAIAATTTVEFDVVSNPEFLREGIAVEDFMKPDRVVIGSSSPKAAKLMETLYEPFVRQGNPIYFMDERSAELTKYAANAYLAMRISFMNEIANLCDKTGGNVDMVRLGMGSDTRIGKRFLFPGIGYGGSCFPKDVLALHTTAKNYNYDFKILSSVINVNELQKSVLVDTILAHFGGSVKGKKIGIWGLAFKPNTDDIREAPAINIINALLDAGATIAAYDPAGMPNMKEKFGNRIEFTDDQYAAIQNADALAILTEWNEFRTPDFNEITKLLNAKVVFDGRNVLSIDQMKELGYTYYSIGRPSVKA